MKNLITSSETINKINYEIKIIDRENEQFSKQEDIENNQLEKKLDELKIKELNITNDKISRQIIIFKAEKNKKYKNNLLSNH